MQIIADHLGYDIKINEDFLSDPKNDGISKVIC